MSPERASRDFWAAELRLGLDLNSNFRSSGDGLFKSCLALLRENSGTKRELHVRAEPPAKLELAFPPEAKGLLLAQQELGRAVELAPGRGAVLGRAGLGCSPGAVLPASLQHPRGNSASPTLTSYRASILTIWGISMLRKQIRNSIPELFLNAVINFRVLSHKTNSA